MEDPTSDIDDHVKYESAMDDGGNEPECHVWADENVRGDETIGVKRKKADADVREDRLQRRSVSASGYRCVACGEKAMGGIGGGGVGAKRWQESRAANEREGLFGFRGD